MHVLAARNACLLIWGCFHTVKIQQKIGSSKLKSGEVK